MCRPARRPACSGRSPRSRARSRRPRRSASSPASPPPGRTRSSPSTRPRNLWRYRELLPIEGEPRVGLHSGMTPLVRADRLAAVLGVKELWVKDDSVNHPTFSYKDRVVSVAISKAIEFGFETVSCASTGNLANSVSAHAARAALACYIFISDDMENGKVIGLYIYSQLVLAVPVHYDIYKHII